MLCMEVLQRKPAVFRALTGVTVEEFWEIYHQFLPFWNQLEQERLSRPDRQRAIGGGRKYLLSLPTMLLMTLLWLRRYWNTEVLAFFFGVDKATVSRNSRRVLKALERMGLASLGWPRPPRRGEGKSLEEALEEIQETCPDLAAIIDGTEQRIQRPQDDDLQRQHYSGRRKAHTRKTILVTNEEGRIWMVALRCRAHATICATVESGIVAQIPEEVPIIGDTGFDGLQNYYPERNIATPHKARRNHPLLPDQKLANRELNRMRIVIEHTLSRIKRFGVLSAVFRHPLSLYDTVFMGVVGIVNYQIDRRLRTLSAL